MAKAHFCEVPDLPSRSTEHPAALEGQSLSRRSLLLGMAGLGAATLAGCSTNLGSRRLDLPNLMPQQFAPEYVSMYAAMPQEKFPIPAVDLSRLKPTHFRTGIADETGERAGTIVVDTPRRYLYLVLGGGRAIRYGVGIASPGVGARSWRARRPGRPGTRPRR
jgi:lipoprotein-anchoring transpeptidase ErfK/SrfK